MAFRAVLKHKMVRAFLIFIIVVTLGVLGGISHISWVHQIGFLISEATINVFKCISLPLISLSIITTITKYHSNATMGQLSRRVVTYTLGTTLAAAAVACLVYLLLDPKITLLPMEGELAEALPKETSYIQHLGKIIPSSFLQPFLEGNVFSALLLSMVMGFGIRCIPSAEQKAVVSQFFQGLHAILMLFTRYLIKVIPVALFGFVMVTVIEYQKGVNVEGIGRFFAVIVMANLIQGLIILPLWLLWKRVSPLKTMRGMLPALSLAFFSKSSAVALPLTIEMAEKKLGIKPDVARYVLPLCTTINMNGCAAFIFATVVFVLECHGVSISPVMFGVWILVATIAAVGNAGVPMGCFFLSASILSGMGMPLTLMGLILPFYSLLDMVETSLNVWSDACVTVVANKETRLNS